LPLFCGFNRATSGQFTLDFKGAAKKEMPDDHLLYHYLLGVVVTHARFAGCLTPEKSITLSIHFTAATILVPKGDDCRTEILSAHYQRSSLQEGVITYFPQYYL